MNPMEQGIAPQGAPQEEPVESPDADPGFVSAFNFIMERLYQGGAARQLAQNVRESQDPAGTIAQFAYSAVENGFDSADPPMAEENLIPLAVLVLAEVSEVAEAAVGELDASVVSEAFKTMLLAFLSESGVPTGELEAAMNQVAPEQIQQLVGSMQDEEMPPEVPV